MDVQRTDKRGETGSKQQVIHLFWSQTLEQEEQGFKYNISRLVV